MIFRSGSQAVFESQVILGHLKFGIQVTMEGHYDIDYFVKLLLNKVNIQIYCHYLR